jgi:hypothetical protein
LNQPFFWPDQSQYQWIQSQTPFIWKLHSLPIFKDWHDSRCITIRSARLRHKRCVVCRWTIEKCNFLWLNRYSGHFGDQMFEKPDFFYVFGQKSTFQLNSVQFILLFNFNSFQKIYKFFIYCDLFSSAFALQLWFNHVFIYNVIS